jgi:hypothetical protein
MLPRVVAAMLGVLVSLAAAPNAEATTPRSHMALWSHDPQFNAGIRNHVASSGGTLRLAGTLPTTTWDDPYTAGGSVAYEYGQWTSPWVTPGFGMNTLVPSWSMTTPTGTWARIEVRVKRGSAVGSWDTLANWAANTSTIRRSSSSSQTDDLASVDIDTVRSRGGAFDGWQLQVTLLRTQGSTATPALESVAGVAASYSTKALSATSTTTMTATTVLNVPTYSQTIHRGEYPTYGGGGAAWCSPATTVMLLRYSGSGPTSANYAFANAYKDPWVDHAAVNSYDYRYGGTGNWSFSAAYAGQWLDAYVTRVSSLRSAEDLIKAGIPIGAAIKFGSGQLTGAPANSSAGHVVAVVGFTAAGNVVVNDPGASSDATVRRTYRRGEFERAWLGGSGGIAYVIRP